MADARPSVLAVIPARGGSKAIPNKNLVPLCGRPLLSYALEATAAATSIDRFVVSSDSAPILALARGYGGDVPLERPAALATDSATSISVLEHALEAAEKSDGRAYGIIVLVQCTNPFVRAEDIDAVVAKMHATGCDACFTVTRANHLHPSKLKTLDGDRLLPLGEPEGTMTRRQDMRDVYIRNGSIYAITRETLGRQTFFGNDSRAVVIPASRSIDINDHEDLVMAEALMSAIQVTPRGTL